MSVSDTHAVISLGTNTIRLLVVRNRSSRFEQILHLQTGTRLGEGLTGGGTLMPAAKQRTLAAIVDFAAAARECDATIECIATSAMRRANDAGAFADEIETAIGVRLQILDGATEAAASFRGATLGAARDGTRIAVLDIGGGSTECAVGCDGVLHDARSIEIGSVRLTERFPGLAGNGSGATARAAAADARGALRETLAPVAALGKVDRLVGVAGTALTIGAIVYTSHVTAVSGRTVSLAAIDETVERLLDLPLEDRRTLPGMLPQRSDVLAAGGLILSACARLLDVASIVLEENDLLLGFLLRDGLAG